MTYRINPHVGDKPLIIETGKLARQADGAVTVQCGETVVLVTVVASTELRDELDFFPLTVDYREKAAAAGKFPGGYFKREGRPTEKEILTARMVDRPCRPLFPEGFYNETQIISILLSADGENDPDVLVINGASAALSVSDIPWGGPIGAVRVGRINGRFVANPTHAEREQSDLDLVYAGSENALVMIEGSAREITESDMMNAIEFAHGEVQKIISAIRELAAQVGKPKRTPPLRVVRPEVVVAARQLAGQEILSAILTPAKLERQAHVSELRTRVAEALKTQFSDLTAFEVNEAFYRIEYEAIRTSVLKYHRRPDGRGPRDLRPISCEVGVMPRTHGSAIFQRGETQCLVLATLGSKADLQEMDAWGGGPTDKRFMVHYNFPPFSVGETGKVGAPGRREIGHGALAERSLFAVVPAEADFPYTIRLTSEILESNGSSSMATVCGGTLALMDAGVPIKAPVAGISIGLFTDESSGEALTVTDIIGAEDHYGDMDFKVAGTAKGITGFQTDLKLRGLKFDLVQRAFEQAREARLVILEKMAATLKEPRKGLSKYAPRITTIKINPEKIGTLIGPQGKIIKQIVDTTGCQIDIDDDGTVHIFSTNAEACEQAIERIRYFTAEAEVGKIYRGKVVAIKDFGAFVEILPDTDGLLHISEIADYRVKRVEDVLKVGDEVWVKVLEIDEKGKVRLSRKAALAERAAQARKAGMGRSN
ncbi:MAG: polyribonucleotide nucleotidyltransferase [Verrucomicrobiae bacterium]|nr:polyribonucleotide nucleotidyltransferase [Verrucomicrobiae bacterium]